MGALVVNAQRTPVKVSELQKPIIDNVIKGYPGFAIIEATKVIEDNVAFYEVIVAKGNTQETLLYDKEGKFVKKLDLKAGTFAAKPTAVRSAAKPSVRPAKPSAKR